MKKCFWLAIPVMAVMASCTSSEEDVLVAVNPEVTFQVANYLSQTKAEATFPATEKFGVYAWYDAENGGATHQVFMDNETVAKSSSDSEWRTSKVYYWPKTGNIDFIGYYPQSATPWITIGNNEGGLANLFLGIIKNSDGTEDYMYADKAVDYTQNNNPAIYKETGNKLGVPILFHHALAKLNVKVKASKLEEGGTKWDITVDEMTFKGLSTSGTLVFDLNAYSEGAAQQVGWTPRNGIWNELSDAADVNAMKNATATPLTLKTTDQVTLNGYTVVPQPLSGKVLHVKYTIKTYNDGGTTPYSTEVVEKDIKLDADFTAVNDYWRINNYVTYNLTIKPSENEILFDPSVAAWSELAPSVTE